MSRKDDILEIIGDNDLLLPMVDDMLFLERHLEHLRALPMIKVDSDNPNRQKPTPASKQYKEFLQQYVNVVKAIEKSVGQIEVEEESPLRAWMNEHIR